MAKRAALAASASALALGLVLAGEVLTQDAGPAAHVAADQRPGQISAVMQSGGFQNDTGWG
ncbi:MULTISPECIES: hypothetical protein [unclassified Streptomyces]|uniref:hypothetical protein n=1 Tax=unclassified Streptomyces TaxID=2593676 RepID=UPI0022B6E340|nr:MULTISPECIES: hypothetical protein [unclassified Streptomyces]MCZ7415216.1 hypothetical protein [Streptomyces sp. WMMC897]MCZ7432161.1 hypothetical protein [Streptomyces sp. WMMC1477]